MEVGDFIDHAIDLARESASRGGHILAVRSRNFSLIFGSIACLAIDTHRSELDFVATVVGELLDFDRARHFTVGQ